MRYEYATLSAADPLETALTPENVEKGLAMPVLADGRLIGLVTAENVGEFFMIRAALANRPPGPPRVPPVIGVPPPLAAPPVLSRYRASHGM
jgi:hypothetical protein